MSNGFKIRGVAGFLTVFKAQLKQYREEMTESDKITHEKKTVEQYLIKGVPQKNNTNRIAMKDNNQKIPYLFLTNRIRFIRVRKAII